MNDSQKSPDGRVEVRGRDVGEITEAMIEKRAREIAEINGRSSDEIFSEDRAAAREELMGERLPATTEEDENSIGELSRDPSNPPAYYGKAARVTESDDEKNGLERIVLEGVEEAQHDQMLEARRHPRDR
ncbi:MAG TPA: hypothetical protein VIM69_07120 [Opitutaceae bacterium]